MNKIKQFVSVPFFIEGYIEKDEAGLDNMTHDFCKLMMESEFIENCKENSNLLEYKFDIGDNYPIKRFLEFYFDKSKLDHYLLCKYEDELDMPKSISNEIFIIELENRTVPVIAVSYKNGVATLQSI